MADLTSRYMGIKLENPVIVSASGLTESEEGALKAEDSGAGAVVMKSVFEEQIEIESKTLEDQSLHDHPEWQDYLGVFGRESSLNNYLDQIEKAKSRTHIPVFGSVNCTTAYGWTDFAKRLADTGIDGLELNVFIAPNDIGKTSEEVEKVYSDIFSEVKSRVSIPIVMKLPPYLTTPERMLRKLAEAGLRGAVLFNRPLPFDIDIEKRKITTRNIISSSTEMSYSLRMCSILAGSCNCDLAVGTGVHDAEAVIKHLFAGATVVQLCSVIYLHGFQQVSKIIYDLNKWMDEHAIKSVDEIRGVLSSQNTSYTALYARTQYLKAFGNFN